MDKYISICDLLLERERSFGDQVYLRQPRHGYWHEFTWSEVMRQARQVAFFLKKIGLKKGDHVSIFSKNCAEWFIADFGITLAGLVNVPLFANQHPESIQYVLKHAKVKLVFLGKLENHLEARSFIPKGILSINFEYHKDIFSQYSWSEILKSPALKEVHLPDRDDLYTIIYSSGTSGYPKGVVFTHQSIAHYLAIFAEDLYRLSKQDHYHLISYLPLAHVYERSAIQLGSLTIPCDVSFVESLETFASNLRSIEPTLFAAVPRIWTVFKQKIGHKLSLRTLKLILNIPLVSSFVKKKIKSELGLSRCHNFFCGSAHLPVDIYYFFEKLGVPIQEGYGQTENFAYATVSLPKERKPGYVGNSRLGVKIILSQENEILMKGPCIMTGYYKDAAATEKAFSEDGWLRTGDYGEIDELGRVKIQGRLSEVFKNQKGEFVNPTPTEKKFMALVFIEQVCLLGSGLKNNILLVSLNMDARNLSRQFMKERLQRMLHDVNHQLQSFEKISHIVVVSDYWTPENNFLTPTLKVKRREVEKRYQDLIEMALESEQQILWE